MIVTKQAPMWPLMARCNRTRSTAQDTRHSSTPERNPHHPIGISAHIGTHEGESDRSVWRCEQVESLQTGQEVYQLVAVGDVGRCTRPHERGGGHTWQHLPPVGKEQGLMMLSRPPLMTSSGWCQRASFLTFSTKHTWMQVGTARGRRTFEHRMKARHVGIPRCLHSVPSHPTMHNAQCSYYPSHAYVIPIPCSHCTPGAHPTPGGCCCSLSSVAGSALAEYPRSLRYQNLPLS